MIRASLLALVALTVALLPVHAEDGNDGNDRAPGPAIGKTGAAFELNAADGTTVSLKGLLGAEGTKAVVVQFAGANCPFTRAAEKTMAALLTNHGESGLSAVAIFSNGADSAAMVDRYRRFHGAKHAMVRDPAGRVAAEFGAEVTPTYFVFDAAGTLRYRGAITGLGPAVKAVLAGGTVERTRVPAVGCAIQPGGNEEVTVTDGANLIPLSPEALAWVDRLIGKLSTEDPAVARSVIHGLQAIGPSALPHLTRFREGKTGVVAARCDKIIAEIRNPSERSSRAGRRPTSRLTMLQMQLRALERLIDVTPEQKKKLREGFLTLRDEEDRLLADIRSGRTGKMKERRRALVDKSQVIVKSILTEKQWERWNSFRRSGPAREGGR